MTTGTSSPPDALLPPEMARRAEEIGAAKVSMDRGRLVALATLAGASIALGGVFSTVALAGTDGAPWGPTRVLAGLVFSVGLVLVVVSGRLAVVQRPEHHRPALVVVPPIAAFVAAGFEHCVANMYFVPFGLLLAHFDPQLVAAHGVDARALTWGGFLLRNLLPVTIGNVIGGALLVGGVYWFVYLRPRPAD